MTVPFCKCLLLNIDPLFLKQQHRSIIIALCQLSKKMPTANCYVDTRSRLRAEDVSKNVKDCCEGYTKPNKRNQSLKLLSIALAEETAMAVLTFVPEPRCLLCLPPNSPVSG